MIELTQVANNVYRSAQPQNLADWDVIRKAGIKTILCLQTGSKLFNDGDPFDEQLTGDLYCIRVYNLPLGEILPPSKRDLIRASSFIARMRSRPILVHCRAGEDRTGMVCAEYLRRFVQTMDNGDVFRYLKETGMHWWYYWWTWI